MCLAIPSKVVAINKETNSATLETLGVQREASLDLMDEEVSIGEYVLLHIGYIMSKIDEEDALESIKLYQQMIESMEDEYVDEEYRV
ncbi:HypC/HybG/HupF family hydrogenase formation chaperone [Helicobacter cappadocius]|uniref:HypC/HybG/HupF family hydrogenase formation chaperone n=1 Tax=Helicobacter cappadocius TaxID=3063998 RepID=A0AA90PRW4_9HELI|nr:MULTISPECIES: HypC/HybG/HupF family hydrogenase formation chaperone [unclassified Helicobacter]MDO7253049.1 HypC/HybG/HupF family hydrogenase formation chaperone [Helicobacter sp. faydin-H75]MDP2538962.1 HypC/HybG/HupF family hydrogenase formation chaperone [Helicobacter sp. faydin-H76]